MTDLLIRVLRRLGLLRRTVLYARRPVCGKDMRIPLYLDLGAMHLDDREPWMGPVLQILLTRSPGTFVDAGVNVGQTLLRVHVISPATTYLGFEPNPVAVAYVQELMRANRITGMPVICGGLSTADGPMDLEFYHPDPADASASIVPDFKQGHPIEGRATVACLHFDAHGARLLKEPLGVVKVDVEGAELEVLAGMREHLHRDKPAIVIDLPAVFRTSHTERLRRQERVEGLIAELGYKLHRIHWEQGALRMEAITSPIGIHSEPDWSNYVAVHAVHEARIMSSFNTGPAVQK